MNDLALLLLELGGLFAALAVLGMVAHRFSLSPIPVFLIVALFFGNGGLIDFRSAEPFLQIGSEIGVILLLLTLGVEFSAVELIGSLRRHSPSGLMDFVLNFPPGLIAGLLLGQSLPAAVALGGVTWVSSSGIVARVLGDLGRLGNRETPAVLSVLVLEDVAMAVFLPILVVMLSGQGPVTAIIGVALALGTVITVIVLADRAGPRLGRLLNRQADDEQFVLRVLGLTMLVAGIAQGLGVSAGVGAFLVGLAIPDNLQTRAREVLGPLRDLFAALFFVGFGLQTAPADVWPVLPQALGLAVVTAATKVATGWFAAGRDKVKAAGRLRAGTALIARGEFSIVIAGLAVSAGYGAVGPLSAAYVLVLAVAGPIITRYVLITPAPQPV